VIDAVGDLVVTQPMPSMPVQLWNDPDAVRYIDDTVLDLLHAAYEQNGS